MLYSTSVRILQEIAYTAFLQQLKIAGSGDSVEVVSDGTLNETDRNAFGNKADLGMHPLVLTLQLPTAAEQMEFTDNEPILGPGFAEYATYRAIVEGDLSPEEVLALLESEQPRMVWSHTNTVIVNRSR